MIQLKLYSNSDKLEQFWIDLYETEPIKLTLSIEDITNTDATSTFSKAFKVPGTRKNAEFFKNSFDVDGILYDVTIKKPAEILVDGVEFKEGNVRLQKVFLNTELDRYDYELLFLGETRDFSSAIGEAGLCELDMPDLIGDDNGDTLTLIDVANSWNAWDGTNGTLTTGLHNGNIIYPLIDHGNSYNDSGNVQETRIALDQGTEPHFTKQNQGIGIDRMKPMIRAKRIVDQIFANAGYTYSSEFFDSPLFHQIYISAFGNEATVVYDAADGGANSSNTAYGDNLIDTQSATLVNNPNPSDGLSFPNNQVDPGGNFNPGGTTYEIAAPGDYTFVAECYYEGYTETSNYGQDPVPASLVLYNYTQNSAIWQSFPGNVQTLQLTFTQNTSAGNFIVGDKIGLIVDPLSSYLDYEIVTNVRFAVTSAPGKYVPSNGLECSYKQIDFIKDILTSFRLVLAPDPRDPKNFIIEPWQTYINSGEVYDWSKKLVENKDVTIEPVFFSQSDVIKFDMQPGGDYTNIYHKQAFSENYGYLEFDSGNELLKGKRDVKLNGIAPTEIVLPEGAITGDEIFIPQLHTHSAEDTGLQHLPIKTKTRMLFYNGKKPFVHPQNSGGPNNTWYIDNVSFQIYPQVSPYQEWPIQPQTLNLNWANDIQYWGQIPTFNDNGSTLYSDYWSRYISSLYNKYSRRVTAYFVLNNIDLNSFSFDDTIFVNGTYYRPEKIIDVEVGAYTEVKVQLLTANDYRPKVVIDEELTGLSALGISATCENPGIIQITTNGTPQFDWTLSSGVSGTALLGTPSGQAPYTFNIENVVGGTYTVYLTDSLGRTGEVSVVVPIFVPANVEGPYVVTNATNCTGANDGIVDITPMGGVAPYTVYWQDGSNANPRTGMVPGQIIPYYVEDANGCRSQIYEPEIGCDQGTDRVWYFAKNFNCTSLSEKFLKVEVAQPPNATDIVTLNDIANGQDLPGCYSPVYETQGLPDYTITQFWVDCESCQGITPPTNNYRLAPCDNIGRDIVMDLGPGAIPQGSAYTTTLGLKCYEVVGPTENAVSHVLAQTYNDCQDCETSQSICRKYLFSNDSSGTVGYTYTSCNGLPFTGTLLPGGSLTDCVKMDPAPQIGEGGTLTDIEPCF